jgi:hypothetical protein
MTGNRSWSGTRIARAVVFAILTLGLSAIALLPGVPKAAAQTQARPPSSPGPSSDVRAVLSQYGNFVQHQRYGEVWVPTATPPGWHPYPPCHWV